MDQLAVLVTLEARQGREKDVADLLQSAQGLVIQEPGTTSWFALQFGPAQFANFDAFRDAAGRDAHLNGGRCPRALRNGGRALCPAAAHRAGCNPGQ